MDNEQLQGAYASLYAEVKRHYQRRCDNLTRARDERQARITTARGVLRTWIAKAPDDDEGDPVRALAKEVLSVLDKRDPEPCPLCGLYPDGTRPDT